MASQASTSKLFGNKKGMFLQIVLGIVVIFAAAFIWVSAFVAQSTINSELQNDPTLDNTSKAVMAEQTAAYPDVFDSGIGLVMVFLFLVVFAFAYKAPSNPIFLVAAILIIAALGFAGMILSNAWEDFSTTSGISSAASSFPITDYILSNFLIVILAMSFGAVLVYLYSSGGIG